MRAVAVSLDGHNEKSKIEVLLKESWQVETTRTDQEQSRAAHFNAAYVVGLQYSQCAHRDLAIFPMIQDRANPRSNIKKINFC